MDRYPRLLGIGIDGDTGLVVKNDRAEVFGRGRVAIYDNRKHQDGWYYWLRPGDQFDLCRRRLPEGSGELTRNRSDGRAERIPDWHSFQSVHPTCAWCARAHILLIHLIIDPGGTRRPVSS